MIQIHQLTEAEIIEVIDKVAQNHSKKAFSYYTSSDIKQEVWRIALEKLIEFSLEKSRHPLNPKKALEHFLNTVMARRLSNLYRDKYLVPQKALKSDRSESDQRKRVNLMHPLDINEISESNIRSINGDVLESEIWAIVNKNLNDEEFDILDALLSGERINCYYKNKLLTQINKILDEKWERDNHTD